MKRLLLNLILPVLSLTASANPISQSEALNIAKRMTAKMHKPSVALSVSNLQNEAKDRSGQRMACPPYYAFNLDNENGFVLVSGDDQFPAILGYSDNGQLPASVDELPCCLRLFLDSYSEYVSDVRMGNIGAPRKEHGESIGTPMMSPMITCKWGQDTPFNLYCPSNEQRGQSIVGCVATAMAQLMYKWKWPETGTGVVSYSNAYGQIRVDFSQSTYNWSIMKNTYGALDIKKETGKAVAKLSYDCGVSVRMDYANGGSGTYTQLTIPAFYTNFRYKASTLNAITRVSCNNTREFLDHILRELRQDRPVLFSASSTSGSGSDAGGHAFVIDGYDSENFLHVNWGWNGRANGYYDVEVMDALSYHFSEGQTIVVGIQPDYEGNDNEKPHQSRMRIIKPFSTTLVKTNVDKDFNLNLGEFYNYYPYGNKYKMGIALFDYNGQLLEVVSNIFEDYLAAWSGYSTYNDFVCKIPKKYDNNGYVLRIVSKQDGYDNWELADVDGGSEQNKIPVLIQNGTVFFNQVPTAIDTIPFDESNVTTVYYDINGHVISDIVSHRGIVVKVDTDVNGNKRTAKIVNK